MITVENIKKIYGQTTAVKGITFDLSPSEILAVIGPSGCGKTTLLRLLAGFERPDAGRVEIDGVEVSNTSLTVAPHERKLSMIFQDLALWPHMTAEQHIAFVLNKDHLSREDIKMDTAHALEAVDLNGRAERYPHELSGGEKQRLAIARALASRPMYLLMDEPFSNVDPVLKKDLQAIVGDLKNLHHMGIIYVSHNREEVFALADRIAILNDGQIEQLDTKEQILDQPRNAFVRRFLGGI